MTQEFQRAISRISQEMPGDLIIPDQDYLGGGIKRQKAEKYFMIWKLSVSLI
jgi:hypothetical protein